MFKNQKRLLYYFHRDHSSNHNLHLKKLSFRHSGSNHSVNTTSNSKSLPKLENTYKFRRSSPPKRTRKNPRIPFHLYPNKPNEKNQDFVNEILQLKSDHKVMIQQSEVSEHANIFENIPEAVSIKNSSSSSNPSNIVIQPENKFFLCRNCFEFYLCIQLKQHNKICHFLPTKTQYHLKWKKLASLLQKLALEIGQYKNQKVYELAKEMEKTFSSKKIRKGSNKSEYSCRYINFNEVFWLIQELSQNINEKESEKKKMIWMPCTSRL